MVSQRIGRCSANKVEKILIYFVSIFFSIGKLARKKNKSYVCKWKTGMKNEDKHT